MFRYSTPAGFQSPEQQNDYNNTTSSENMSDYLSNSNTLTTGKYFIRKIIFEAYNEIEKKGFVVFWIQLELDTIRK